VVELLVGRVFKFGDEVDLVHLVETFSSGGLLLVLEKCMDGNGAGLTREMLSLVVGNSLVIVVETDLLGRQHLEASHLYPVLLGQVDEVAPIFLLGVGVVYHYALSLAECLVSHFVALLLGLESVSVDPHVFGKVVDREVRLS
jgi:hypothetical protein